MILTRFQSVLVSATLVLFLAGCQRSPLRVDVSGVQAKVDLERFDRDVFLMSPGNEEEAIRGFYESYGDFFDVFNVHVISIGPASQKYYPSYLSMFVNDPENREVYNYTSEVFADCSGLEEELSLGFRHYLYYYPDSIVPRVIGYVSRFNQKLFTVGRYIGVGLDQYLGSDCRYYEMLRTPAYQRYNNRKEKIPSDVMRIWASSLYPYNDSLDNLLNHMIYNGMLDYFTEAMLPGEPDSLRLGFTPLQTKWCQNNEQQMWTYLIEHKLLFSTDPMVIKKLTDDAPYTYYFTGESPGKAANWQGLQIVRAYVKRNPEVSLPRLMAVRDYQQILTGSRYDP
ncbi:MAG: hypothetical protein ACOYXB_14690 [Bacteroidota bacterium]